MHVDKANPRQILQLQPIQQWIFMHTDHHQRRKVNNIQLGQAGTTNMQLFKKTTFPYRKVLEPVPTDRQLFEIRHIAYLERGQRVAVQKENLDARKLIVLYVLQLVIGEVQVLKRQGQVLEQNPLQFVPEHVHLPQKQREGLQTDPFQLVVPQIYLQQTCRQVFHGESLEVVVRDVQSLQIYQFPPVDLTDLIALQNQLLNGDYPLNNRYVFDFILTQVQQLYLLTHHQPTGQNLHSHRLRKYKLNMTETFLDPLGLRTRRLLLHHLVQHRQLPTIRIELQRLTLIAQRTDNLVLQNLRLARLVQIP
jgi:hypothetical protein